MNTQGLIHIYCGDGKGKTTAAVGLSVRAAGADKKVLFVQFFKNGNSSEIRSLQKLEGIRTLHASTVPGRFSRMSDEQRVQASSDYTELFRSAAALSENFDLLILDEIISACNLKIVDEALVTAFLDSKPDSLEVVLTGRDPSCELTSRADYITSMEKIKHPYDQGIRARKGIEF